ncbi:putative alpha-mannosidase [Shigella flexneri]|nr:putative alpha-mannosidase [Shigella flexneri]
MRAEIALMSGSAFAVTHHAFSSGAGRTSDGNGSHASTLKSPSYTKSVSWQHYLIREAYKFFPDRRYFERGLTADAVLIASPTRHLPTSSSL